MKKTRKSPHSGAVNNILVTIRITDKLSGISTSFDSAISPGIHIFTVTAGYREIVDIVGC